MILYIIGWLGVVFGLLVAPPQLHKIITTRKTAGISLCTYIFLVCALVCYLIHAIDIKDAVFIVAQSINLTVNSVVLFYLVKYRRGKH